METKKSTKKKSRHVEVRQSIRKGGGTRVKNADTPDDIIWPLDSIEKNREEKNGKNQDINKNNSCNRTILNSVHFRSNASIDLFKSGRGIRKLPSVIDTVALTYREKGCCVETD